MINEKWLKQYTPEIRKQLSKTGVVSQCSNHLSLDDLTQEVIMVAIARQDKYDESRGSTATWLSLLVSTVVRDARRKTSDAMSHVDKSLDDSKDWLGFDVENDSCSNGYDVTSTEDALFSDRNGYYLDNRDLIDYHIARLPSKLGIIVKLRMVDGYSHREIADIMNISEENSMTMYHRGRQDLKSFVDNG